MPFGGVKITKSTIFSKYVNLKPTNWPNLKTNWYKHFITHVKPSLMSKIFFIYAQGEKNNAQEPKMPFGGVKITKSPIIQQISQFEV